MKTIPYKSEHLDELEARGALGWFKAYSTQHVKKTLERSYAFTAVTDKGSVIGCLGVLPYWENRGEAWAILDKGFRGDFLGMHNAVRRFLDVCPYRRVEATVEVDFVEGHRWAKLLGFELEAPLVRAYFPNGQDCSLYARVRKD